MYVCMYIYILYYIYYIYYIYIMQYIIYIYIIYCIYIYIYIPTVNAFYINVIYTEINQGDIFFFFISVIFRLLYNILCFASKATGFKSLRLNCWNIIQVIYVCKISISFSRTFFLSIHHLTSVDIIQYFSNIDK